MIKTIIIEITESSEGIKCYNIKKDSQVLNYDNNYSIISDLNDVIKHCKEFHTGSVVEFLNRKRNERT